MSTPPINSESTQPTVSEIVANGILNVSFSATTGALAGYLFSLISPVGGAIFGAVSSFSRVAIGTAVKSFFGDTTSEKAVRFALKFFGSVMIALAVTLAAGFTLTFKAGVVLSLCMVPTALITAIAFGLLRNGAAALEA